VPDLYPDDTRSDVHRELGTDRFLVEWRLREPRVETALAQGLAGDAGPIEAAPVVTDAGDGGLPATRTVRVEIPNDIFRVRARAAEEAAGWRERTRRAFRHYLDRGYVVAGFHRKADRSAYVLTAP
jgi:predicted GNAT superfamily acetyltransferase